MKINNYKIFIPLVMMAAMTVFFSCQSEFFLSQSNIINILREASVIGIVASGLSFVMAAGDTDLSTGGIVGFLGMVAANMMIRFEASAIVTIVVVLIAGVLCGLFNYFIISKLGLSAFICTIATKNIFRGLQLVIAFRDNYNEVTTISLRNKQFLMLGKKIGPVYYVIFAFVLVVLISLLIQKKTRFGLHLLALGSNSTAASLSGIHVKKVRCQAFCLCGLCCAIASLFLVSRVGAATAELGTGLEFDAMASVIIGGAVVVGVGSGGDTSAVAGMVGALFLEMLINGIYKINMPTAYQTVFKGLALILMIFIDAIISAMQKRRRAGRAVKQNG